MYYDLEIVWMPKSGAGAKATRMKGNGHMSLDVASRPQTSRSAMYSLAVLRAASLPESRL